MAGVGKSRDGDSDTDLLSDPAWDMMLDLYRNERRVPASTALCWIAELEDQGLICRQQCPEDRRSSCMFLTDQGRAAMEGWAHGAMRPPAAAEFKVFGKVSA